MKRKSLRKIIGFLLTVLGGVLISVVIYLSFHGMFLIGIPEVDNVERVILSYPEKADETAEFTEKEDIELAVQISGFLHYSFFGDADPESRPLITVTYVLENGRTVSVSADRDTVWWKGKAYPLKQKDMFVNLTEGLFFS